MNEGGRGFVVLLQDSLRLVRIEGRWVVDYDAVHAGCEQSASKLLLPLAERSTRVIQEEMLRIGKPDATCHDIRLRLSGRMIETAAKILGVSPVRGASEPFVLSSDKSP